MKRFMAVGIVSIDLIYTTPKLSSVEDRHTTVSSRRYHHRPHPTGWRRPHHRRTQCQLWPPPRRGPCGLNALCDDNTALVTKRASRIPACRPHLNRADPPCIQEM